MRVKGTDSLIDVLVKMSDGNPGASTVLARLSKHWHVIDPHNVLGPLAVLLLDTFRVYGEDIWIFYKDVCGSNLRNTVGVIRACQLGYCANIKGVRREDVARLIEKVEERIGKLNEEPGVKGASPT